MGSYQLVWSVWDDTTRSMRGFFSECAALNFKRELEDLGHYIMVHAFYAGGDFYQRLRRCECNSGYVAGVTEFSRPVSILGCFEDEDTALSVANNFLLAARAMDRGRVACYSYGISFE